MDPYKVLGLRYDATEEEIKKAYRSLSRKYHPDANVGKPNQKELEEKFTKLAAPYMGAAQIRSIIDSVWSIDQMDDVGALTALMAFGR